MKADETFLLTFLNNARQLAVPIYQRTYSWEEPECQQLWDDILRTGSNDQIETHFLGSIVCLGKIQAVTNPEPMLIIDGQQRLTTITILLEAIARSIQQDSEIVTGFSTNKIRDNYLHNANETGEKYYKLVLNKTDKETLFSVIDDTPMPSIPSIRIKENFAFFMNKIAEDKQNLLTICEGIAKLMIVDISLDWSQDNPQLIFESLNSTGKELSQADLIRNFVLMGQEKRKQDHLYNRYWYTMETSFGQENYANDFDDFMRYYLTVKNGITPNKRDVYKEFKLLTYKESHDIEPVIKDVHKYSQYYCYLAFGQEPNSELDSSFFDLQQLKTSVTYPLLLELYDDYENNVLSLEDFITAVRIIESYIFRRAVCDIQSNSMKKTFESFARKIDKSNYLESLTAQFLLLQTYRRFPDNQEFIDKLAKKDIYNFQRREYLFRRLENYGRKEAVSVNEYTIEHIMPQNENLSPAWRESLGENWEDVHSELLHTLGNLTLTGYNSEYSDRPFVEKRDMKGGFRQSPLLLNKELGSFKRWDKEAILHRADLLSKRATEVWPFPDLPDTVINRYRPVKAKSVRSANYTIEDHKRLMEGSTMHSLFSRLSQEIQDLDPIVVEDYRKTYVSYKVEGTLFVTIEGYANSLQVDLCMPFAEIYDPRKMAKQIPPEYGMGRSEARVKMSQFNEIPYVMGLIRQAFRHLIEDEDEDNIRQPAPLGDLDEAYF